MHHIRTPMKPRSRNPAATVIATTPAVLIPPPEAVGFGVGDGGDETFEGDGDGGDN